jgi:hypothetical protein
MNAAMRKSILETVLFFETQEYALSLFELWKWQMHSTYTYSELSEAVTHMPEITFWNGHLFLTSVDIKARLAEKQKRYRFGIRKHAIARRISNLMSRLPSVQAIALCNTRLPLSYSSDKSDIDFFVIARRGEVWLARLLTLIPLKLLHMRPGERKKDAIDFTFFLGEDADSLQVLTTEDGRYFALWIHLLFPLADASHAIEHLFYTNSWTRKIFPNSVPITCLQCTNREPSLISFRFLEPFAKWIQNSIVSRSLKEEGNSVVLSNQMIKAHVQDKRADIYQKYRALCEAYDIA